MNRHLAEALASREQWHQYVVYGLAAVIGGILSSNPLLVGVGAGIAYLAILEAGRLK